jgi:predicted amidohydrolase
VWRGADDKILAIDYLLNDTRKADRRELALTIGSPDDVATLTVVLRCPELGRGTVEWSVPTVDPADTPATRRVVVASARIPVGGSASAASNLARIVEQIAEMRSFEPDLICLPEMCASWGMAGDPREVAIEREPVLTALAQAARAARSYLVAAFYERCGVDVYNTALLMDRVGGLVGEYRKTHLTALEKLAGVRPGRDLDVFETDFGVVGIVVCWDLWHPEPARLAALNGAQIIAWPFEQDRHSVHLAHMPACRAMENGVVIVGASQATSAPIVDADGTTLAVLDDGVTSACAEIELGGETAAGTRWPRVAPSGANRRNLIEHERNAAISAKIAELPLAALESLG